jgi:hypothetical protein
MYRVIPSSDASTLPEELHSNSRKGEYVPSGLLDKTSMAKIKHIMHPVAYQDMIVTFISYTRIGEDSKK